MLHPNISNLIKKYQYNTEELIDKLIETYIDDPKGVIIAIFIGKPLFDEHWEEEVENKKKFAIKYLEKLKYSNRLTKLEGLEGEIALEAGRLICLAGEKLPVPKEVATILAPFLLVIASKKDCVA